MSSDPISQPSSEDRQLQMQWESVRMGLGWCFFGALWVSAAVLLFFVAITLGFQDGGAVIGGGHELVSLRDVFFATVVLAIGMSVAALAAFLFGMALCCVGPPGFPGRVVPGLGFAITLLGFSETFRGLLNWNAGIQSGYGGPLADMAGPVLVLGVFVYVLASLICLLGFVHTVAVVRGSSSLVAAIRSLVAGFMIAVIASICCFAVLVVLREAIGELRQVLFFVLCLTTMAIIAVGIAFCDKILYQAWRLIPPLNPPKRQGPFPSPPHPLDPIPSALPSERPPQKHPLD